MNPLNAIDKLFNHFIDYKEKYIKTFIIYENIIQIVFDICIFSVIYFGHINESFVINKWYQISMITLVLTAILLNMLEDLEGSNLYLDVFMQSISPVFFSIAILVIFGNSQADIELAFLGFCYSIIRVFFLKFVSWFKKDGGNLAYYPFVFCLVLLIPLVYIETPGIWLFLLIVPFFLMQYRAYILEKSKNKKRGATDAP